CRHMADVLGTFEQAVLLGLVRAKEGDEPYGPSILKEGQTRLKRDVAAGAVSANLDRLESKGLNSSRLGGGTGGRGGRTEQGYAIEQDGVRALSEAKEAVESLWAGIQLPLKGTV